ncbi:MAG: peptidylprolyl isomerase [Anaerolineae bacterium]|nr:peptidylprolyl isomerase [Anaerolineae bacterium]
MCEAATPAESPAEITFGAAEQVLQADTDYLAVFCTAAGPVLVDLYEDRTPVTVNSFVFLARSGYFNNTNFHRVMADFMAQGGDPTNTGSGGPGYQFEDEILDELVFDRPGLLAMANAGPGTNGSQFFITTAPTDWLNGAHTIFGEVLAGQSNVENIRLRDPQQSLEPGTLLEAVLIVEGADNVIVEEETLAPVTDETVTAAQETLDFYVNTMLNRFGAPFGEVVGELFTPVTEASGLLETDAAAATAEGAEAAAAEYLASHNHEYSLAGLYANEGCELDGLPIYNMSFRMDVYPAAEDAAAALEDPALDELQAAQGFEAYAGEFPLPYAAYTRPQTACEQDMVEARIFVQRGRFVVRHSMVVTADNLDIAAFLPEAFSMPMFEDALADVIRPETAN